MKHDELCKKLEGLWHDSYKAPGYQALRAVVALHKPKETTPPWAYKKYLACSACENYTNDGAYFLEYPCPTIKAIEKELE